MNEEIKRQIDQKVDDIFMDNDGCYWGVDYNRVSSIKETMYELYLLGAKDAIEAVKLEKIESQTGYERIIGFNTGWNVAVDKAELKAQQFIDSLGKE